MHRVVVAALALFCLALSGTADAADKLVLQSKWLPQAQFAGYYVARDKGLYRQARRDVTIDWMPSALAARDKGAPIVNIAQIFQRSGLELTCRRDSGIRQPADFKGKTIAVWFVGNEYPFLAWMAKLGFTTSGPS